MRRQWYASLARTEAQRREFAALADAGELGLELGLGLGLVTLPGGAAAAGTLTLNPNPNPNPKPYPGGATPFLDTRRAAAHRDEQRRHLAAGTAGAGTRPKRGWPRGPRRRMAADAAAEPMPGGEGAKEETSGGR